MHTAFARSGAQLAVKMTIEPMHAALEAAGVIFVGEVGPGVRLRKGK